MRSPPLLGCIADDYTGATDLSSMLVRAKLRVIQCFGTEAVTDDDVRDADAVVVALKSRSIDPADAVKLSLAALRLLQRLDVERFFFKYCSTFDSTPRGNIGPVADALADSLGADEVIFCPAFPENGRTVVDGHLLVNGVPLNETGMRHHPLNPMTDSNLVRVLQSQSRRSVGRLHERDDETPSAAHVQRHWIADAATNDDLRRIATAARDHRLLTGGSAIARFWVEEIVRHAHRPITLAAGGDAAPSRETELGASTPAANAVRSSAAPCVILAGSCSDATRGQIAEFARRYPVLQLTIEEEVQRVVRSAVQWVDQVSGRDGTTRVLISSAADPAVVAAGASDLANCGLRR